MANLKWSQLKKEIDEAAVVKAIIGDDAENLTTDKVEMVRRMVYDAAEYFLPMDLQWFTILGVELEYLDTETYPGAPPEKGIKDLVFQIKDNVPEPYAPFSGLKMVADWKTTKGELNTTWRRRYIESQQWKRYCIAAGAALCEFRGVSTATVPDAAAGKWRHICGPLILQVPNTEEGFAAFKKDLEMDLRGLNIMRNSLMLSGITQWPRSAPDACGKYGVDCEFLGKGCLKPGGIEAPPLTQITHSSYSSDDLFKLCPEKYRLSKSLGRGDEDFESSAFLGTIFHRGIATIYTHFKEKNA